MHFLVVFCLFLPLISCDTNCNWASRLATVRRAMYSYGASLRTRCAATVRSSLQSHPTAGSAYKRIYPYATATSVMLGASGYRTAYCKETEPRDTWYNLTKPNKRIGVYSPLSLAARSGNYKAFKQLLDAGADLRTSGCPSGSVLHMAAQGGNIKIMKELVACGGDVWLADAAGELPIHKAVEAGQDGVVSYLLTLDDDQKTMINMPNGRGKRLLDYAIDRGPKDRVEIFLLQGALVQPYMLKRALIEGNNAVFTLLFEHSSNEDTIEHELANELLIDASRKGRLAIARYLLHHGADIDGGSFKTSPLIEAAAYGHTSLVTFFCSQGANLDKRDTGIVGEFSALHKAARNGHTESVRALLDAGADPCIKDILGAPPSAANLTISWSLLHKRISNAISRLIFW